MSFPSVAVDPGMSDCTLMSKSEVKVGLEVARNPATKPLDIVGKEGEAEKNVLQLHEVTVVLNRLQLTVQILELQLEAERREKNAWKSKYEELERTINVKEVREEPVALIGSQSRRRQERGTTIEPQQGLSARSASITKTTLEGPKIGGYDTVDNTTSSAPSAIEISSSAVDSISSTIPSTVTNDTINKVSHPPALKALRSTYAPPITAPAPEILQRVAAMNPTPCWDYYLGPQGCPSGAALCMFPHHHRFTRQELLALKYIAQMTRCPSGLNCVDKLCYYGHQCQVLDGEVCQGRSWCAFKEEEHFPEQLAGEAGVKVDANVVVSAGPGLQNAPVLTEGSSSGRGVVALPKKKTVVGPTSIANNEKVAPTGPKPGLSAPTVLSAPQSRVVLPVPVRLPVKAAPTPSSVKMAPTPQIVRVIPKVRARVDAETVAALLTAMSSQRKAQRVKDANEGQGPGATRQRRERRARAQARAEEAMEGNSAAEPEPEVKRNVLQANATRRNSVAKNMGKAVNGNRLNGEEDGNWQAMKGKLATTRGFDEGGDAPTSESLPLASSTSSDEINLLVF